MEKYKEIILKPIGIVKSKIKEPILRSDEDGLTLQEKIKNVKAQSDMIREMITEIIIEPDMIELLDGIEDHSHILILYWAHKVPDKARKIKKVHPMGLKELPEKGIFATCSPARPNPILLTTVRLIEKKENILKVTGFEAIDGSPVIDIKPYSKVYHNIENQKIPEWLKKIYRYHDEALA